MKSKRFVWHIVSIAKTMFRFFIIAFAFIPYIAVCQSPVRSEWRQTFKTSLNSVNKAIALDFDRAGNAYVAGQTWLADSSKNVVVVKYAPDGKEIWRRIYNDPKKADDIPMAMTVDIFENVWVTGMVRYPNEQADFFILKFSPDGIPSDLIMDGPGHLIDCGTVIYADTLGYAYAGGYFTSPDSGIDMQVVKVNPEMKIIWKGSYATPNMDIAAGIVTDDSGGVYVASNVNMAAHSSDILLSKFGRDGSKIWDRIYDGSMKEDDHAYLLLRDDSSHLFIAGYTNHVNSRSDLIILKYGPNGKLLGEFMQYGKVADNTVQSLSINSKHLLLTGRSVDYNLNEHYSSIFRYNRGGKELMKSEGVPGITFMRFEEPAGYPLIAGSMAGPEENMLIPYIASVDTGGEISWSYADQQVFGITRMIDCRIIGRNIYFLADDVGEATGTITLLKYSVFIPPPVEQVKPSRPK